MAIVFVFNEYTVYIKRFGVYYYLFSINQTLLDRKFIKSFLPSFLYQIIIME